MNLEGRSALVTGGASGLGLAAARELAGRGAAVVIADLNEEQGQEVATSLGSASRFVRVDVTDEIQVAAGVTAATEVGTFSVVVNCAGISIQSRVVGRKGPFPLADFRRVIDVNLNGTFNVLRLAAEQMAASPGGDSEERGVIINTASVAAYEGQIGQAAYAASKGGIVSLTLPVARELAQHRIRVMTIAPGLFLTPLFEGLGPEVTASLGEQIPHPSRLGKPEEYAALVGHIVQNPMLNGETIRLDGAIRMGPR